MAQTRTDDTRIFTQRLRELEDDRSHGASELARRCLQIVAESALQVPAENVPMLRQRLAERVAVLAASRPSMAPVANLLARWEADLVTLPEDELELARQKAADVATVLVEESHRAVQETATRAAEFIGANRTLMTHSLSSTVSEVFHRLHGHGVHAIVTESRPLCEGQTLVARLSQWSIPTVLITDAEIGLFMHRADIVIIGADSVLADGSVVNKAGTYPLALVADDQEVPVYVCCESFKWHTAQMSEPKLEEMDPSELGAPELPHVMVSNVYFDITPARLITGWITEHGLQSANTQEG